MSPQLPSPDHARSQRKRGGAWTQIRIPQAPLRRRLQQRHWLRVHVALMGLLTLAAMLGMSALMLHSGVHSMAVRYGVALLGGYAVYLVLLRLWAACMLRRPDAALDSWVVDLPSAGNGGSGGPTQDTKVTADAFDSAGGGDFAGGGASGHWSTEATGSMGKAPAAVADQGSKLLPDWGGIDGLDLEGVVLLPVLLVFGGLLLLFTGAGTLLWAALGTELLLAVAVEVAMALLMARSLYVMEREGWLLVALRMSWKPMLAAVLVGVLVGALCDWWLPGADSLGQVLRSWQTAG